MSKGVSKNGESMLGSPLFFAINEFQKIRPTPFEKVTENTN